ncbi:unnamed protein product, partial [Prorocentrum cordatum]
TPSIFASCGTIAKSSAPSTLSRRQFQPPARRPNPSTERTRHRPSYSTGNSTKPSWKHTCGATTRRTSSASPSPSLRTSWGSGAPRPSTTPTPPTPPTLAPKGTLPSAQTISTRALDT